MEKGRQIWGKLVFVIAILTQLAFKAHAIDVTIDTYLVGGTNWTQYAPHGRVTLAGFLGGSLFYTMDGSTPSRSSIRYTNSFVLTNSVLLRAITYTASSGIVQTRDVQFNFDKVHTLRVTMDGGYSPLGFVQLAADGTNFFPILNGSTLLTANQTVALRVVEKDGWFFDRWKGPKGSTARTNVVTMTSTFEVRLSLYRNSLEIPEPEGNGRVVVDRSPPFYTIDPDIQVTAIPDEGYYFAGWNQPAATVGPISYAQRFNVPVKKATFLPLPENNFSVSARVEGRGDIVAMNNRFVGPVDEVATFTFLPRQGWGRVSWSGDALDAPPIPTNTVRVRLDANKSIAVHATNRSVFVPERNLFAIVPLGDGKSSALSPLSFQSPAIADDGTMVIGARAGTHLFVEGFDRDGYNIWEARSTAWPGAVATAQPSIGPSGVVYIPEPTTDPALRGMIAGYSLKGDLLFRIIHSGSVIPNLCVNQNGLYVGCPFRRLQRFSLDGTLVKDISAQPEQAGMYYSLAPNGDLIVSQSLIQRYNSNLELKAQGDLVGAPQIFIAPDSKIYFNQPYYGMSSNLTRIWTNAVNARTASIGISQIYISDANGRLAARRITDGFLQWTYNDPYTNSAFRRAIALADGNLIATFSNNTIRKISSLGTLIWEMTGVTDAEAEPILTDDGILHAGLEGYQIGVGPALSGFPMLHGDWRRSGAAYVGPLTVVNQLSFTGEGSSRHLLFTPGTLRTLVLESKGDVNSDWSTVRAFDGPLDHVLEVSEPAQFYRVVFP